MKSCEMIVSPSYEGSPDIECGKPITRSWENVPCCEDCYQACAAQEERDAAMRAARAVELPSDRQGGG